MENMTAAIAEIWTQINNGVTTITSNPVMMLSVAVPFAGAIIGLTKRLLRFGGGRRR